MAKYVLSGNVWSIALTFCQAPRLARWCCTSNIALSYGPSCCPRAHFLLWGLVRESAAQKNRTNRTLSPGFIRERLPSALRQALVLGQSARSTPATFVHSPPWQ